MLAPFRKDKTDWGKDRCWEVRVALRHVEATKPVSQDWGKAIAGRCWRHLEVTKPLGEDWGKVVVGRCWRHFDATKPVSQDLGNIVVGRC